MAFLVCTHQCVGAWMCRQVVLFTHHPQNRTLTTHMVAKDATRMISFFGNATQSGFALNEQAAMQDSQEGDGPFWISVILQKCTQGIVAPTTHCPKRVSDTPNSLRVRACGHCTLPNM